MQRISQGFLNNMCHILLRCSNMRVQMDQIRRLKQSRTVAKSKPKLRTGLPCFWYLKPFCFLQIRTSQSFPAWLEFTIHSSNLHPLKTESSPLSVTTSLHIVPKKEKISPVISPCFPISL